MVEDEGEDKTEAKRRGWMKMEGRVEDERKDKTGESQRMC